MGAEYLVIPADMDLDLWHRVDNFKWDNFDYRKNLPVFDDTKTTQTVPVEIVNNVVDGQ